MRWASGKNDVRLAPTGLTVGSEGQLRHRSGLPDRSGDSRCQAAAISPAPCPSQTLRQPRRHYAAPASSDDARNAPTDNDLRRQAQVTAPSDVLTARRNHRPCNAICPALSPRAMSAEAPPSAPRALGNGSTRQTDLQQQALSEPMPRAAAAHTKTSAQDGSGVPCNSRNAQALGTDRNTYLTSTHSDNQQIPRGN